MSSSPSPSDPELERVSRETLLAAAPDPGALTEYEQLLREEGSRRGLLGPRELDRLWSRHLLNCAIPVFEDELVPHGSTVMDVGTGAGLPGLVWSLVRPDLSVILVDSQKRRSDFLREAVESLKMEQRVQVLRERVEDLPAGVSADIVTARALGPLDRIVPWLAPRVRAPGRIVALKGQSLPDEMAEAHEVLTRYGLQDWRAEEIGDGGVRATVFVAYKR